jgi:hypothetical protein
MLLTPWMEPYSSDFWNAVDSYCHRRYLIALVTTVTKPRSEAIETGASAILQVIDFTEVMLTSILLAIADC